VEDLAGPVVVVLEAVAAEEVVVAEAVEVDFVGSIRHSPMEQCFIREETVR
jgi:hypothetical protein